MINERIMILHVLWLLFVCLHTRLALDQKFNTRDLRAGLLGGLPPRRRPYWDL